VSYFPAFYCAKLRRVVNAEECENCRERFFCKSPWEKPREEKKLKIEWVRPSTIPP